MRKAFAPSLERDGAIFSYRFLEFFPFLPTFALRT